MSSLFKTITLPTHLDQRGAITVLQDALPFEPRRIYWIYNSDGQIRGGHRHKKTIQALVAIKGAVEIYMNDGINEERIMLDEPGQCLIILPKDWHTMIFHDASTLLAFASEPYDRDDYIDQPYKNNSL